MSASDLIRVVFCDDEPNILDGLRRQFRSQQTAWEMRFASNGEEVLTMLESEQADVVIADMRMPLMDGGQLLKQVRERWPQTVRFVLSGQTDQGELLDSVGSIHQFLQKPTNAPVIVHAVSRAMELAASIHDSGLTNITAGLESLPVLSTTYTELSRLIKSPDCGISEVSELVRGDIGLSTKLLQLVNSSFFGLPRGVVDVKDAVSLIGIERIRVLTITSTLMDSLTTSDSTEQILRRLWKVSLDIGNAAASLAKEKGHDKQFQEAARLAGVLSLVGRAIMLRAEPDRYISMMANAKLKSISLTAAETIEFGVPQHAIGAYALGLWAFGDDVVESVARQASPELSRTCGPEHAAWFVHEARRRVFDPNIADRLAPVEVKLDPDGPGVDSRSAA